jgi:hypothetical protein
MVKTVSLTMRANLVPLTIKAGAGIASAFLLLAAVNMANSAEETRIVSAKDVTAEAINQAHSGRTAFESGKSYRPWRQFFGADGSTIYFGDGPSSTGSWEVRGNQYCSVWPPSTEWVCYDVELTMSGAEALSIVWIGADGARTSGDLYDGDQLKLRSAPKR